MQKPSYPGVKIKNETLGKIAIPTSEGYELVNYFEIIRCEADVNYTRFILSGNKMVISAKPLKRFEVELKPYNFQRVHQHHLVNLEHAVKYLKGRGGSIALSDKSIIPVSFRHKKGLLDKIKKMR